jgi:UDP-N-acetylmuramoyl-L-alanyl-D-glutamate--2,6-diaminopimelate ligase
MKLEALLAALRATDVAGRADAEVRGVAADSRQVRPGYVFVAVPGTQADGWAYADEAVRRGAVAVVSGAGEAPKAGVCHVRVADPRLALARLSRAFHGDPAGRLQVVGVTGTNGKTTTACMVRAVLEAAGRKPGLIGTVEYRIGARAIPAGRTTPDAAELQAMLAQMLAAGCASVAMEVSSHALDQRRTDGIDFDVAAFTNLTRDHLDYHRTMEDYFRAKSLLFSGLGRGSKKATAVVNADDAWGRRLLDLEDMAADRLTFGMSAGASVRAERVELGRDGSAFVARTPWGDTPFRLQLLGRFNVANALAAAAACGALGIDLPTIAGVLSELRSVPGRLEQIPTGRGFQVFVDYAHTDDALQHVLSTLREITPKRLLLAFGCGGNRDTAKRPAMGRIAARLADHTVVTSDNPRKETPSAIIAQIREGFGDSKNFEVVEDRRDALRRVLGLAADGDVVLVAGKGHETFQEFANTTIPFDDRQVLRELLGTPPRRSEP